MAEFDVEAFVAHLHGMGLKLSAIPLADGSFRIGRWRMVNAADDQQIQEFWASQVGENQQRIDALAAYLAKKVTPIISSATYRPPSGAPTPAPESVSPIEEPGQTAPPAAPPPAAVPHSPTIAQRSASIQAATLAKIAAIPPSTGVPRTPLSGSPKGAGIERPAAAAGAPEAHKPPGLQTGSTMPRPLGTRPAATGSRFFGAPTGTPPGLPAAPATASPTELNPGRVPASDRPAAADGRPAHNAPAPADGSKDPAS